MLNRYPSKLEARSNVCLFVGYPKGTKGYIFYDPQEQKVIVSTNARFLEEDYMMNNKPKLKTIIEELRGEGSESSVPLTKVNRSSVASTQRQGEPRRSGRVVRQPERFIGLGEVLEDPEIDSYNYKEGIQDKDATLWQKAMKTEMESTYSNQV